MQYNKKYSFLFLNLIILENIMYKQILNINSQNSSFLIPPEFMGKKIEISIRKIDTEKEMITNESIVDVSSGIFKERNVDPIHWQNKLREEWSI